MIDRYDLQRLRDLPIEGVAGRLGLRVERHKCLCPFHDDHHASMSFKVSRNRYRCFVCGASGGPIDLVMKYLGKDFREAVKWLADENNIILTAYKPQPPALSPQPSFDPSRYERFFEHPWLSEAARRFLFDERRLDERVVRWCRLTSWRDRHGTDWLQTPYYDTSWRLTGIQNRNLSFGERLGVSGEGLGDSGERLGVSGDSNHEPLTINPEPLPLNPEPLTLNHEPRFRFPAGAVCSIYNLPVLNLLRPGEPLWITEGCSDCWAMLSAGHKAVAIPSATLLKPRDVALLEALSKERETTFHMYPDRDEPGERLFLQLRDLLPNLEHHQLPPDCKDYAEYFVRVQSTR
jgi:hypothetical protein